MHASPPALLALLLSGVAVLSACGTKDTDSAGDTSPVVDTEPYTPPEVEEEGIPALGGATHDLDAVELSPIAIAVDDLVDPMDVGLNPADGHEDELWVVCADSSVVLYNKPGEQGQTSRKLVDPWAEHSMASPSSIAFGAATWEGSDLPVFATCQSAWPEDGYMGASVWSSDTEVFAQSNKDAVAALTKQYGEPTDHGSYLDMLHESPACMGIAWEVANIYWAFDGSDGSIVRYDFGELGEPGFDDHSDGLIQRYAPGELARVEGVHSGMAFDGRSDVVYIADSGNNSIKAIHTFPGTQGEQLPSADEGSEHYLMDKAEISVLIEGAEHDLVMPSGLDVYDDFLVVADRGTGILHAFDISGQPLDYLDTGLGPDALQGLEVRSPEEIWVVDGASDQVIRLQPAGE